MAQVSATQRELENAFKKHYNVYKKIDSTYHPMTRRLLLFYSVESGLKCLLLKKISKNTTDELQSYHEYDYLKGHGHDIKFLIKAVNLEGQAKYTLKHCSALNGCQIEPEQFHQIWRYGIETGDDSFGDQSEAVLKNIALWLDEAVSE
jgi:hypothetical protein